MGAAVPSGTSGKSSSQLLVFSGTHPESVNRFIANTIDYISATPSQIGNACYTLACHRQRLPNRAFVVGSIDSWDISKVHRVTLSPDLVWVFTGQGSQYPEMGRDLIMSNAIARDSIQQLDRVLDDIDPRRSWSLLGKPHYPYA
jgi:acyl transferase domain-containing protein